MDDKLCKLLNLFLFYFLISKFHRNKPFGTTNGQKRTKKQSQKVINSDMSTKIVSNFLKFIEKCNFKHLQICKL